MSPSPSRQPLLPVVEGGKMSSAGRLSWQSEGGKRMATFAAAIVVALASGSNYGFSAYAPQLASKLHLSSTQINMVGLAGNFGVYLTGPLWGKMVDAKGPRLALMLGGCFAFTGYAIVHAFYVGTIPIRPADAAKSDPVSSFNFLLLGIAMFMTGNGGSAGLFAAVNATAKSFPDKTRASATGTVLSGFGLSAFFFSAVGHLVSGGDAGGLLLLLTFGTGLPIFIASFIVQPVPPSNSDYRAVDGEDQDAGPESSLLMDGEDTHGSNTGPRVTSLDLARSRSPVPLPRGRLHLPHLNEEDGALQQPKTHTRSTSLASVSPLHLAYTPRDLAMSVDFWTLFTILAVLCGTGLMYINNAGTVALALARDGKVEYDVKVVSAWQAKQVGTVSVWNCAGRILGGIFSDFCKTRFKMQRIWFLPIVAFGFVVSQAAAISTTQVQHLWIVSTLLGLSYGSLFNVLPMLVLEWFGMKHFSQNYGWMCIAPVIGGNIFNILFGRVYDSNTVGRIGDQVEEALNVVRSLVARAGSGVPDGSVHDCLIGTACYSSAFKLSLLACTAAFILSIIAGVRRERLRKTAKRNLRSSVSEPSATS